MVEQTRGTLGGGATARSSDRAAYRRFVRTNHPDAGGDPEVFIAGLRQFQRAHPTPSHPGPGHDRYDAPIRFTTRPRGLHALIAGIGRRHRGRRPLL